MNKIRATVSGKIQNVGYRAKVIGIARSFGLTGFIQNLEDGRVRIIAESKNGDFEKFIDAIRIKNTLIDVLDVEVGYADATGDFADFYKLVSGGETDERLDTAAEYLKEMIGVMRTGFSEVIEKQSETTEEIRGLRAAQNVMIEKQDVMIEKQDVMIEKQDVMIEKQDAIIEKQDAMIEKQSETTEEIRGLREDMKRYMDRKFGEIEGELDLIKSALKAGGMLN